MGGPGGQDQEWDLIIRAANDQDARRERLEALKREIDAEQADRRARQDELLARFPDVTSVVVVSLAGVLDLRIDTDQYLDQAGEAPAVEVAGEAASRIVRLFRALPPDDQRRCHIPPCGLRFRAGAEIVGEVSICWSCNNVFGIVAGERFHLAFDGKHATSVELFRTLRQHLNFPSDG